MNKTLVAVLALLISISYGYSQNSASNEKKGQANSDSIVIFTFKPNRDMFFVPYQDNKAELDRLLKITKQYDAEIKGGKLPVFISGYCYNSINPKRNLTLAKTWSNRVKAELIVRRKLKEEHFITRNHAKAYNDLNYAVVVMLKFPREIIKEEFPEEEEEAKAAPSKETIVIKEAVEDESTGEKTEIEVIIPPKEEVIEKVEKADNPTKTFALDKTAATFSIHTNLLYWAIATPNLGAEWRPDTEKQWGLLLNGAWAHWQWKNKNRKYRMWMVSPEVRRYLTDRWFVGAELHIGEMNIKLSDTGRQGTYYGGGVLGGYRLPISSKFDIDFTLGLGYTRFNKDNYEMIEGVHVVTKKDANKNLFGPTQAGIILRYKLK